MHGVSGAPAYRATNVDDSFGGKSGETPGKSVKESPKGWFADVCKRLLPRDKPGQALVCDAPDFGERDCHRYAIGEVKPPGYFIRALLRSKNGWTWLNAIMDGCDVPWWAEIKRARRIAEALRAID